MDLAEGEGSRLIKIGHMVHVARKLHNLGVISNFHNFILNFCHVVVTNVSMLSQAGFQAIHIATARGKIEIVEYLLDEEGVSPRIQVSKVYANCSWILQAC